MPVVVLCMLSALECVVYVPPFMLEIVNGLFCWLEALEMMCCAAALCAQGRGVAFVMRWGRLEVMRYMLSVLKVILCVLVWTGQLCEYIWYVSGGL